MALRNNPLSGLIATLVVMSAMVGFGIGEVTIFNEGMADYAVFILALSLVGGYLLSDYDTDQMDQWEFVAVLVPIGAMVAMMFVGQVETAIADYQPWTGIGLTGIALVSYYVIMD